MMKLLILLLLLTFPSSTYQFVLPLYTHTRLPFVSPLPPLSANKVTGSTPTYTYTETPNAFALLLTSHLPTSEGVTLTKLLPNSLTFLPDGSVSNPDTVEPFLPEGGERSRHGRRD